MMQQKCAAESAVVHEPSCFSGDMGHGLWCMASRLHVHRPFLSSSGHGYLPWT